MAIVLKYFVLGPRKDEAFEFSCDSQFKALKISFIILGRKLQQRKSFLKVLLVTVADDMLANKITAAMGQLQVLVDDADEAVR